MITTYYEIRHGNGCIRAGKNDQYSFDTEREAIDLATEFKNDPSKHSPAMSDDNIKYWKNQTYTIVKIVVETVEIKTI